MKIHSYRVTEDRFIEEVPWEEGSPDWFEDPVHRWLDIEAPTEEELRKLLAPLEIDERVLKACLTPGVGPRVELLAKVLFIEIPTHVYKENFDTSHVALLCLPTTLVSIHREPLPALTDMAGRLAGRVHLKSAATSALVYQIIGRLALENFLEFSVCRQMYETLSERLLENPDDVEPEEIFALRRRITSIGDTNEDHAFCVDVLQKVEAKGFHARDQLENFKELDRTLDRHQRSMDRLEENVKELHQQFLLAIQDRTGNRLKILTILSAIFLPLTLIAGIYGMNFTNMPELGSPYGYFIVMGFMIFVGIAMLVFFYKRGWFD